MTVSSLNDSFRSSRVLGLLTCAVALVGCPQPNPTTDVPDASTNDVQVSDVQSSDVPSSDVPSSDVIADDVQVTDAQSPDAGAPNCTPTRVLVALSDYANAGTSMRMGGSYALGSLNGTSFAAVTLPASPSVNADHVVRTQGCNVFDLWRTFPAQPNEVQDLTVGPPFAYARTLTLAPMSGQAANPSDIAKVSDTRAYVPLYNSPEIAIVNLSTFTRAGTVSLASVSASMSDMNTESSAIVVTNGRAYVAAQLLDNFAAPTQSAVVVIDTSTDALVDLDPNTAGVQATIATASNPPGPLFLTPDASKIVMVGTGDFTSTTDGAVTIINRTTHTVARTVRSADFNGEPQQVVVLNNTTAWAVVKGTSDLKLVPFNLETGAVSTGFTVTGGSVSLLRLSPDGTKVWAAGTMGSGLSATPAMRVFNAATGALEQTLPVGAAGISINSFDFVP